MRARSRAVLAGARRDELAAAIDQRHWRAGLVALCGVFYISLGATASGAAGTVGIIGRLLIWGAVRMASHSHRAAYALLLTGAVSLRHADLVERDHTGDRHSGLGHRT